MESIRKLKLLRRIKRRNRCADKERKREEQEVKGKRSISEQIRIYKLARKIRKRREEKESERRKNERVSEKVGFIQSIERHCRTYRIARNRKRHADIEAKIRQKNERLIENNPEVIAFKKEVARRKKAYIGHHIRNRVTDILLLRYTFKTDSHGVFNSKQGYNIILHGIAYFLIAYSIIYGLHELGKGFAGWINGVSMKIYYYDTLPILDPNSWMSQLVKMIYTFGPSISLSVLIISMLLLKYVMYEQGKSRVLLVYLILISAAFSIGEAGISTFVTGGLSHFYVWSWWSNGELVLMFVLCLILLITIGHTEQNAMIFTSTSFVGILPNRAFRAYFRYQYIIPTAIGLLIVYFIKQPMMLTHELIVLSSIIIILLSSYISLSSNTNVVATDSDNFVNRLPMLPLIVGIALLLIIRIVGADGILLVSEYIE